MARDKMRSGGGADLNGDNLRISIGPICGSVLTVGLGLGLGLQIVVLYTNCWRRRQNADQSRD